MRLRTSLRTVELPQKLRATPFAFAWFSNALNENFSKVNQVILDFGKVEWFHGSLCAVLGAYVSFLKGKGIEVTYKPCVSLNADSVNALFRNNGFYDHLENKVTDHHAFSAIPFSFFPQIQKDEFEDFIEREMLGKIEQPVLSGDVIRKIRGSIFEIYQNCVQHSGAKDIYICGQLYPTSLHLAIADIGHTIPAKVRSHKPEFVDYEGSKCIEWAVQIGNTTKVHEAGGLGLNLIREFLTLNQGTIRIISGTGYWQEVTNSPFKKELSNPFLGTIVYLEVNLMDTKIYYTRDEINNIL